MVDNVRYRTSRYNHFVEKTDGKILGKEFDIQKSAEKPKNLGNLKRLHTTIKVK